MVVIGGGYTGMWTAWQLLEAEPGIRVALLESGVCGHGPSGRNGGFCESLWFGAPRLRERFGDAAARALLEASSENVADIGAWCRDNDVDAWFDQGGYVCASTGPAFDAVGTAAVEAARALGAPDAVQPLTPDELGARVRSPVFRRGVFVPDFATVQPARLALGLRRRLVERGAQVFERSRVRSLRTEPGGRGVVAATEGGSVRAGSAVLALGPATRSVRPLRSRLSVTSSHIVLTEPVPDVIEELGWTGGESVTDGRALLRYFRTTRDGRIAFGWGGGRIVCGARIGPRDHADRGLAGRVAADLVRFFPALRGRRVEHAWGGPIDAAPAHLPIVAALPGGRAHAAFGYTGNGVGPSHLCGAILARLALDERDALTRLPIVEPKTRLLPPEPLRVLGGEAIRVALDRKERAEEAGREPAPLARAVAALPRLLGVEIGR